MQQEYFLILRRGKCLLIQEHWQYLTVLFSWLLYAILHCNHRLQTILSQIQEYIFQHQIEEQARILVQIHDELILEIKSEIIKEIAPCFKKIMETAVVLSVPLEVKIRKGKDWGKMEELDI